MMITIERQTMFLALLAHNEVLAGKDYYQVGKSDKHCCIRFEQINASSSMGS